MVVPINGAVDVCCSQEDYNCRLISVAHVIISQGDLAMNGGFRSSPDEDRTLLIGMLIDVSGSMADQIGSSEAQRQTRLEAVRDSLDNLAARIQNYCADVGEDPDSLVHVFAYGFGFGNLLTKVRGMRVGPVQSLFPVTDDSPVLMGNQLLNDWPRIKSHVLGLTDKMLGSTPMVEAFKTAERVFAEQRRKRRYRETILVVVSDGLPTDPSEGGAEFVLAAADRMRDDGIIIVSCFVTATDVTVYRKLYDQPQPAWPAGARLMFDCASPASDCPAVLPDPQENRWDVPAGARLFAQVNESELLKEFMGTVFPEQAQPNAVEIRNKESAPAVHVFVSYSHVDSKYVADRDSLLSYLRSLEREGVSFCHDRRLTAGDSWDSEIQEQMGRADIAVMLISQWFLKSAYCRDVELAAFMNQRKSKGLQIVPVLISPCEWGTIPWLSELQLIPADGRNIEQHYSRRGPRLALYLDILNAVRKRAEAVRARTGTARSRKQDL